MNEFYFILSKIFWWFANPATVLVLLTAVGVFCLWRGYERWGRRILSLVLGMMVLLTLLPLRQWVVGPLESRFPAQPLPREVTGIIILGGALDPTLSRLRGQVVLNDAAERLSGGARLARLYPRARLVYSGGSAAVMGAHQDREADYAAEILADLGVAQDRCLFERDSRNSFENALYTKKLLNPQPGE
ncbi:MAG: YdcF family protein, partial [Alphaproteobacteria bacterium]|nr:YdcF family protein [Alphaproteobacteria bacterium]